MSDIKFDAKDGAIIQTIQDAVKTEVIGVQPGEYTTREVYRVPKVALAASVVVSSLTGLVDYLNKGIDGKVREELFVQVDGPASVSAVNAIPDREERRFIPVTAKADTPDLVFDQFVPKEKMTVMLQSRFVENDEQADLLMKLGTLIASEELHLQDDGVTQGVTLQQGVRRVEETIQNPVLLRPFRTFTEVEQPESPFIVRVKKDDREGIQVGLFEADGGAWRNTARLSIKKFIETNLDTDIYPVIA